MTITEALNHFVETLKERGLPKEYYDWDDEDWIRFALNFLEINIDEVIEWDEEEKDEFLNGEDIEPSWVKGGRQ